MFSVSTHQEARMGDHEVKGLPYGCDYAKTNRSHCKDKDCEDAIDLVTFYILIQRSF